MTTLFPRLKEKKTLTRLNFSMQFFFFYNKQQEHDA